MVLGPWSRRLATLSLLAFVLGVGVGVGVGVSAPNDPVMVFGADAGVVLTFVTPDKADDFERVLDRFRSVLEESDDPIRRQQGGDWRVFRSPDPGPAGAVMYVSFIEPVLKGANYNMADIMAEELPEDEAQGADRASRRRSLAESEHSEPGVDSRFCGRELPPKLTDESSATP